LQATKSQSKTASLLRISFDQVHRIMHRSVERGMKRRDPTELYQYLSIDEKAVHKGHDYISILSDESCGIVLDVVEGRTKESVDKLCKICLSEEQRREVKTICTDMWDPYIYGAKTYFPKAKHCHDNFHLVSYLNKAVDKVRRREVKHQEDLKKTKYLFLKDQLNLTEKQRITFDAIKDCNYETSRAWRVKENFRDIQFRQTEMEAFYIYLRWRTDAKNAQIKEITEVVKMFDRHTKGIINAIETGASNARAERINGAIQELKTRGRGYRKTENFRIAILFFNGNLKLFPQNSQ
jgi:transposase